MILIFALALRLYFFVGPNLNDDIDYIFSAHEVSEGRFYPLYGSSINAIRWMMTLPIAVSFRLFGVNIFSSSLYPISCSLGTIIATFYIGKILVNYRVGLISALILSFFPLDIAFSTQLVPTVPVTMFMTLALLLFLYAEKYNRTTLFFLSGIMMGFSYLANIMTGILALSISISYIIIERRFKKKYFLVLLGFLLVFSLESLLMLINTGNAFHRLNVIHETEKMIGTNTDMGYYPRVMLKLINVDFNAHEGNLGVYFYVFIIACVFSFIRTERGLWFLVLSFVLIMLYFEFGVMTSNLKPIAKWVRYLLVFGPTFSILIGYMFEKISNNNLKIVLISIFLIVNIPYIIGSTETYRSWTHEFWQEYNYLKNLPRKTIYTDQGSKGFLEFYSGYEWDIRNLEYSKLEEIKDSYVIVNGSRGVVECKEMRNSLPDFAINPPKEWELLAVIDGKIINPKIYYVP